MLLLGILVSGCHAFGPPRPYGLRITRDDSMKDSRTAVDLVVVNQNDMTNTWCSSILGSMGKYWGEEEKGRREGWLKKTQGHAKAVEFEPRSYSQEIASKDPMWPAQTTDLYLVVLADLRTSRKPGSEDPQWRLCLPLDRRYWPETKALEIDVSREGVRLVTPPARRFQYPCPR
jgi:hypothetical protein